MNLRYIVTYADFMTVCGPVQLLQSAKKAVREVSTMEATREGLTSIDFFEETLGQ